MNNESLIPIAPGLDEPLEILEACHGRIESQLATLERLLEHVPRHGSDVQAQQAASAVIRYFDSAGRHHHEDEEMDLFPRLRRRLAENVDNMLAVLLAEHAQMERTWPLLRSILAEIAVGQSGHLDPDKVHAYTALYRRHIERENRELFPLAKKAFDAGDIAELSAAMTTRRSI
ncbi:MAG: hemerythrin domain-containing protein [Rhodocyclaceae bacterium]|nr:hemerythrin domain-containing protein [Rhodocyclaceae bacterium]